jgi:hypothetical protein
MFGVIISCAYALAYLGISWDLIKYAYDMGKTPPRVPKDGSWYGSIVYDIIKM